MRFTMLNSENSQYIGLNDYYNLFSELWCGLEKRFFKYESRQVYDSVGDEAYRKFLDKDIIGCEKQIFEQIASQADMYLSSIIAGSELIRVRFIKFPITDYTNYELLSYSKSALFAEKILIILEDKMTGILPKLQDFVLFDKSDLLVLDYDERGVFKGAWLSKNEMILDKYSKWSIDLIQSSVPLGLFKYNAGDN